MHHTDSERPQGEVLCFLRLSCNFPSRLKRRKKSLSSQKQFNLGKGRLISAPCLDLFGNVGGRRDIVGGRVLEDAGLDSREDAKHRALQLPAGEGGLLHAHVACRGGRDAAAPDPCSLWVFLAEFKDTVIKTQT